MTTQSSNPDQLPKQADEKQPRRTQSAAERERRSLAVKERDAANPGAGTARGSRLAQAKRDWAKANPEAYLAQRQRASERMKALHQDPAFKARRDLRSSRVALKYWSDPAARKQQSEWAAARYAAGGGFNTPEGRAKRSVANKWIMTQATGELKSSEAFTRTYSEAVHRARASLPYERSATDADYHDYLKQVALAINADSELRAYSDTFMSEAIPRWARAWQDRKNAKSVD